VASSARFAETTERYLVVAGQPLLLELNISGGSIDRGAENGICFTFSVVSEAEEVASVVPVGATIVLENFNTKRRIVCGLRSHINISFPFTDEGDSIGWFLQEQPYCLLFLSKGE
jgi:hypothetical protein